MGEFVRLEVSNGVGTIRLDRPKMNALDAQMQREIIEACTEADERDDIAAGGVFGGEDDDRDGAARAHVAADDLLFGQRLDGRAQVFNDAADEHRRLHFEIAVFARGRRRLGRGVVHDQQNGGRTRPGVASQPREIRRTRTLETFKRQCISMPGSVRTGEFNS